MAKRIMAAVLCILLGISYLPEAALAAAVHEMGQGELPQEYEAAYINPAYASILSEEDLLSPEDVEGEAAPYSLRSAVYEAVPEAGEAMREQMKERNPSIAMIYLTPGRLDQEGFSNLTKEILNMALQHTGEPTEGDYLAYQYGGYRVGADITLEDGKYRYALTYTMTYYTTVAQEDAVDQKVAETLQGLGLTGKSGYQKIKAIYDFVCQNVSYDYSHLNDPSYKLQFTAYAALMNGTAVCQGYANLLYRLLLESGVDARILSGDGVTSSGRGPHAWNIAALGDAYFLMDSTWDRSSYEVSRPYEYFMKGSDKFTDHILESKFLTDAFQERHPISQNDLGLQGDFCYQVKDGKAYLLSYNADAESLTAPSTFGGYPLTGVGKRAFSERQALKTVVFEEGLKDISPEGFFQCQGLTSIALPSTFGDGAQEPAGFAIGCGKLSEVTVPESSANFCTQDGVLYTKNKDSLLLYPAGKAGEAFQIPEGVERIAASAFANAGALKTVQIPKSVRSIGEAAFSQGIVNLRYDGSAEEWQEMSVAEGNPDIASGKIHAWGVGEAVKEPACEMEGERRLPCIACDETKTEPIAALGHDFAAEYTVDKEATCGEEGSKSRHCIRCEAKTDVTVIAKGAHVEEVRNQKEATCEEDGYSGDVYCSVCDAKLREGEAIPKTGNHAWDKGTVTEEASCEAAGKRRFACTLCGEEKTEPIAALGHEFAAEYTIDKEATCREEGSKSRHCIRCEARTDVTVIAKGAHVEEVRNQKEATCQEDGYDGDVYCSVCDAKLREGEAIPKTGNHAWDKGTVTEEASCEAAGKRRFACTLCGEEKTEPIAALGHEFAAEYTIDKEATCKEEGSKSRHCSRCEAETDVTAIPSVEHLEEVRNQREATCHQYGNTGDRYCALCNERLAEGERIPKTSHLWDAGVLTLAPTETMSGTKTFTCTVCFMARTEKVPALGKKEEGGKKEEDDKAEEGGLTQKPSVAVTSFTDPGSKLIFTVKKQENAVWVAAPVNRKASKIVIPSKVEWKGVTYRVTGISPKAFRKCRRLSSVKIPKTVESIGAQAFMGCRKLKDIQISTTKLTGTSVGAKAFQGISKKAQIKAPKKKRAQYRKLLRKKGVGKKATVK